MVELVKKLCDLDGPSGSEEKVAEYIENEIRGYADEIRTDNIGNLIVFKKGAKTPKKKIMFCAHMDEIGFIVKSFTEDGMIKFGFCGGMDPQVIIGKRVRFGEVLGVIGIKAAHMTTLEERKTVTKPENMYIDIGASSKAEAQSKLSVGDCGTFNMASIDFGDNLIRAKAIDDRFGCAMLIELIKSDLPYDAYFSFNTQEEVGLRGAMTSAYSVNPDIAVIVEATSAADISGTADNQKACWLGKGVVLTCMDYGTIYDEDLLKDCIQVADNNNILWQHKTAITGANDSGVIHKTRAGVRTLALSLPVRYLHSPVSVANIDDMKEMKKMLVAYLREGVC